MATVENGIYTEYIFDRGSVIADYDNYDNRTTRYIRGFDLISQKDSEGTKSYYLHNAHGDVTKLVDVTGSIKNSYSYDAFGNTTAYTEQVENRFRYAGEQYDAVTGQYYLRARYYEPELGRFTQEDPYRGDGLNLYVYVSNNPLRYIDPSGNQSLPADIGWLRDVDGAYPFGDILFYIIIAGEYISSQTQDSNNYSTPTAVDNKYETIIEPPDHAPHPAPIPEVTQHSSNTTYSKTTDPDPFARPGQKKQGRERKEKKKNSGDWDSNPNKRPEPLKKHTPGNDHRKYKC